MLGISRQELHQRLITGPIWHAVSIQVTADPTGLARHRSGGLPSRETDFNPLFDPLGRRKCKAIVTFFRQAIPGISLARPPTVNRHIRLM
jgi:hypothetical protein